MLPLEIWNIYSKLCFLTFYEKFFHLLLTKTHRSNLLSPVTQDKKTTKHKKTYVTFKKSRFTKTVVTLLVQIGMGDNRKKAFLMTP